MTTNRSARQKGTQFERLVANYLAEYLEDDRIDRRVKTGRHDRGDIAGLRIHGQRIAVECKNTCKMALPDWVAEAHIEAGNDDALVGVVIHKRHGSGDPSRQWVSMEVRDLVALITGQKWES